MDSSVTIIRASRSQGLLFLFVSFLMFLAAVFLYYLDATGKFISLNHVNPLYVWMDEHASLISIIGMVIFGLAMMFSLKIIFFPPILLTLDSQGITFRKIRILWNQVANIGVATASKFGRSSRSQQELIGIQLNDPQKYVDSQGGGMKSASLKTAIALTESLYSGYDFAIPASLAGKTVEEIVQEMKGYQQRA